MTTLTIDLSPEDFDFVRDFVKREAAISLDDGKEYLVTSRLAPLVRSHQLDTLQDLIAVLRSNPRSALGGDVLDAMTTNETSFFRDVHPFETLRDHILPELIGRRGSTQPLRIWCGAASSGQEPYSIAMIVKEHFPDLRAEIIATDISPSMLAKAEKGEYSQLEVNRGLPAPLLVKYFQRHGARWQISEQVRSMVTYSRLNLADNWATLGKLDVIFMRNVLIYFDMATKTQILTQARTRLADDGYLILGGAETTVGMEARFERTLLGRSIWYRAS